MRSTWLILIVLWWLSECESLKKTPRPSFRGNRAPVKQQQGGIENFNRFDSKPQQQKNPFGFKGDVELLNGRMAMFGLGAGLVTEAVSGKSIFEQVGLDHFNAEVVVGTIMLGLVAVIVKRINAIKEQSFIR